MCANPVRTITSSDLIDIEQNFRVTAGPGAGKTYWLVNHIKNVLRCSERLSSTSKVACITYTNQGVEEIQNRLGDSTNSVEVSTIHSFLYKNVLRPHAFLLSSYGEELPINLAHLDGHEEHLPLRSKMHFWLDEIGKRKLEIDPFSDLTFQMLSDLDWVIVDDQLVIFPRSDRWQKYCIKHSISYKHLEAYKKLYWKYGQIHHEDVLYFSYKIISKNDRVVDFIASKFPYIFIDEFQDTHPLQTAIVKEIGKKSTIIGIIGDPAQSIFSFIGAKREDFISFQVNGMQDYEITSNRRSTNQIIQLLNHLRTDINQNCVRKEEGLSPCIQVGDLSLCLQKVQEYQPTILARNNATVSELKMSGNNGINTWDSYRSVDSNLDRVTLLHDVLYAVESVISNDYSEGLRYAKRVFRRRIDNSKFSDYEQKVSAIELLDDLTKKREWYLDITIRDFNNYLYEYLEERFVATKGAKFTRGKVLQFAITHKCRELISEIQPQDNKSSIRTIHKAKGAEYPVVLIVLKQEKELDNILRPSLNSVDDESRIYYVALSRAKDKIIISVPSLNKRRELQSKSLGFEVERLTEK